MTRQCCSSLRARHSAPARARCGVRRSFRLADQVPEPLPVVQQPPWVSLVQLDRVIFVARPVKDVLMAVNPLPQSSQVLEFVAVQIGVGK